MHADHQSEIQYTRARDGTRLAFQARGDGPAVVFTNGFATSSFYWQDLLARLDGRARLVTWDLKGHGASEPGRRPEGFTIAACSDDLARVMDAAEVERATLVGFSVGCQIILEAWRHIPGRVAALIPLLGSYERPFDGLVHPRVGPLVGRVFHALTPAMARAMLYTSTRTTRLPVAHRVNQLLGMVGHRVPHRTMRDFYEHLTTIDPVSWLGIGRGAQRHTALDLLDQITAPTLVVTGGRDLFTPATAGQEMARRIPDCEHVHLPEATHAGLYEEADRIAEVVESFLTRNGLLAG